MRYNQNILLLRSQAFAMAALLNTKERPLKRTGNNCAPKTSSMTLEIFMNIHGTVGGFEMKDGCVASLISTQQLVVCVCVCVHVHVCACMCVCVCMCACAISCVCIGFMSWYVHLSGYMFS